MKHVNYTCDFCGVVMTEEQDKHHIQARSTKSESMSAWGVLKEWQHVCGPCYLAMESKFKSMKGINGENKLQIPSGDNVNLLEVFRYESNEVLLERALELAGETIFNYQRYCDIREKTRQETRSDIFDLILKDARHYEKQFKEAIEEIKASKR